MSAITTKDRAYLADYVYEPQVVGYDKIYYNGHRYKVLEVRDNKTTGYYGAVYQDKETGELIVAHRGTETQENLRDIVTDGAMGGFGKNPQAQECHLSLNKNGSNRLPKMSIKFMISLTIHSFITEVH